MRSPVAWLALFFAVTGTAIAAGRAITSGDIANSSVSAADVGRRTLTAEDFRAKALRGPRGARGPKGPTGIQGPVAAAGPGAQVLPVDAFVSADAKVAEGGDINESDITQPSTGVYCFTVSDADWAVVTSTEEGQRFVAADRYGGDHPPDQPCPAGTTIRVSVFNGLGALVNSSFHIAINRGAL